MPSERPCNACGRPYMAQRSSSKFCSDTCRMRAARKPAKAAPETAPAAAEGSSELYDATLAELQAAGLEETRIGRQALTLATKVTNPFDTGSAVAAMSRELDRLMEKALASVPAQLSRVDEMKARRDAKRNRATAG